MSPNYLTILWNDLEKGEKSLFWTGPKRARESQSSYEIADWNQNRNKRKSKILIFKHGPHIYWEFKRFNHFIYESISSSPLYIICKINVSLSTLHFRITFIQTSWIFNAISFNLLWKTLEVVRCSKFTL